MTLSEVILKLEQLNVYKDTLEVLVDTEGSALPITDIYLDKDGDGNEIIVISGL